MKSEEWIKKEYKRLNKAISKVDKMKREAIQEIKFARLNGGDDSRVFGKWVALDRQLKSVKDRCNLVYKIWKG